MSEFLENCDFIDDNRFEHVKPIDSNGNTSLCYIVQITGKSFFLKQLRPELATNQAYRTLFRKEFELGYKIKHKNIVEYDSLQDNDNDCYILMENIVGETLNKFIISHPDYFNSRSNLDKFFNQLLSALKCLHENHVIYSDLKPDNIMITQINNDVKLIDLGFCFTDSYRNTEGTTREFSAPEHINKGKLDVTTDIYGVGKIIEYIDSKTNYELPKDYHHVMSKCLEKHQADRWQSIDEILTKLNRRSKTRSKWLVILMVTIVSSMGYVMWKELSTSGAISHDIVEVNYINYSNFNKDDMTCEAIGEGSLSRPIIYISECIDYQGEEYKVTSISNSAFKSHIHIKAVHIPNGLIRIGNRAFMGCDSLLVINIPNSVTKIGEYAFYGSKGATDLILPQNIKEIPTACFVATKISRLNIPEGVEVIKLDAFALSPYIKEVKIPSTVKHLERGVFFNCLAIEKIELPASLERADEYLFFGCEKLKDIYIHAIVPPQALALHRNPSQITLHVPAESVEAYRNAEYWKDMNIVPIH